MANKKTPVGFKPTDRTPADRAKDFELMAKAMVKPKSEIVVARPSYVTRDMLLRYGFEEIKRNTFLQDGIEVKKDKEGFYIMSSPFLKVYLAIMSDIDHEFEKQGKTPPELIEY